MRYRYEGFIATGQVKRGFVDAENEGLAVDKLRDMGIFANKMEPDGPEPMKNVLPGGEQLPQQTAEAVANPGRPAVPNIEEKLDRIIFLLEAIALRNHQD